MTEIRQPVVKDYQSEELEKQINLAFFKVLWEPLLAVLKKSDLDLIENAVTIGVAEIIKAMKNKTIFMQRNKVSVSFTGKFNATISKEFKKMDGTYNKRTKSWNVSYEKLPQEINAAQGQIVVQDEQMKKDMLMALPALDQIQDIIEKNADFEALSDIQKEVEADWRDASRDFALTPEFTEEQRENINKEYTTNMNKYVVDFSEKQVIELRNIMEESLATGARADTLVEDLQARFAISERKAKFLAKQETRLLTTQYYHERATVAGCKRFRWSTSHDFRVRDLHKHLDGKIFSLDNLPVIHTGKNGDERGLPAQAFGCRCRAIYLFD